MKISWIRSYDNVKIFSLEFNSIQIFIHKSNKSATYLFKQNKKKWYGKITKYYNKYDKRLCSVFGATLFILYVDRISFYPKIWNPSLVLPILLDFLSANSVFAVFGWNVSTANYEGRLYRDCQPGCRKILKLLSFY